jgi:transposase
VADKKKQKRYTKEFKIEAVKLVTEKGMKVSDVARDLGISQPALGAWIKDYQRSGQDAFPGKERRSYGWQIQAHPMQNRPVREHAP